MIFNQRRGRLGFSEIASTIVLIFLTFTNALSFRAEQIVREADDAESRDLLSLLSQRSVPNIRSLHLVGMAESFCRSHCYFAPSILLITIAIDPPR